MMRNDTRKWSDNYAPKKLSGNHMPISLDIVAANGHPHTPQEGDAIAREALHEVLIKYLPQTIEGCQKHMNTAAAALRADAEARFQEVQELSNRVDKWFQEKSDKYGNVQLTIPLATDRTTAKNIYDTSQKAMIDAADKIRHKKLEIAASIEQFSQNYATVTQQKFQSLLNSDNLPVRDMARSAKEILRTLAMEERQGFQGAYPAKAHGDSSTDNKTALNDELKGLHKELMESLQMWRSHFTFVDIPRDRRDPAAMQRSQDFDNAINMITREQNKGIDNSVVHMERGERLWGELFDSFEKVERKHLGYQAQRG